MRSIGLFLLTAVALGACDSPPTQPQQSNRVNATQSDQAFPSSADGNDIITGSEGGQSSVGNAGTDGQTAGGGQQAGEQQQGQ